MMNGWVKLHRSLMEWEWYDHIPTKVLFIHLILSANHKDGKWRGVPIKRGQLIGGRKKLAKETGLTEKQVRIAMNNLEGAKDVTKETAKGLTVITLANYEVYQQEPEKGANDTANNGTKKGPKRGQGTATLEEGKKGRNKEDKKGENAPAQEEFLQYAQEKAKELGYEWNSTKVKSKYFAWKEAGWKDGKGNPIKNWKSKLLNTLPYLLNEAAAKKAMNKGWPEN